MTPEESRLQLLDETDQLVLQAAPSTDRAGAMVLFGMFCGMVAIMGKLEQAAIFGIGGMLFPGLLLLSMLRRERATFSAQGCLVRRTLLGLGVTRSYASDQIRGLRVEQPGEPRAIVFDDLETGGPVRLADFDGTQDPELLRIHAAIAERFPAYAAPTEPLSYSPRYRLTEEDSRLVLTLKGERHRLSLPLGLLTLSAVLAMFEPARLAIAYVMALLGHPREDVLLGSLAVGQGAAALGGLWTLAWILKDARRERVEFSAEGCELTTTLWGLGATRRYSAGRIRGLRPEGTVPPATSKPAASLVFDDVEQGRLVSFASDLAHDPALGRVYAALIRRYPAYAEAPALLPLSPRVSLARQSDRLEVRLGGPYPERLEMTSTGLRWRKFRGLSGRLQAWLDREGDELTTMSREAVVSIRLASVEDWRNSTIHSAIKLFCGLEILSREKSTKSGGTTRSRSSVRVGAGLDETESRALLARLWEFWPETADKDAQANWGWENSEAAPYQLAKLLEAPPPAAVDTASVPNAAPVPSPLEAAQPEAGKTKLVLLGVVILVAVGLLLRVYWWAGGPPWAGPVMVLGLYLLVQWVLSRVIKGPLEELASAQADVQSTIKRMQAEIDGMPRRISLAPAGEAWKDSSAVGSAVDELKALGFEEVGAYRAEPLEGVALVGLVNPGRRLSAVVYEHPTAGTWMDIVARYQDGTSFTATSMKASGLEDRPGHSKMVATGADGATLLERMADNLPAGELTEVGHDSFVTRFEQSYAEATEWRIERGGLTPQEVAAVIKTASPASDE